jgi:hypothetical protein
MYTVFRITGSPEMVSDIAPAMEAINVGSMPKVDARVRGDGYAVGLCDHPDWENHIATISWFIESNRDALALARASGGTLAVDVAVEPGDVGDAPWLSITVHEDLMNALSSVGARFIVSLYGVD